MGFEITIDKEKRMSVTVDRKLWLAADQETLVEDGSPDAAFLWAAEGDEVDEEEANRVGYKARSKPADKSRAAGDDKSAPNVSARKADWVEHAVAQGMDRDEAEAATKDDLVERFG